MKFPYTTIENFLPAIDSSSIFLEIGSEPDSESLRIGAGSTAFLSELAAKYNVTLHSVDICNFATDTIKHNNLVLHTAQGSAWCQHVLPTLNQKISLVYLDNFDVIWDSLMLEGTYESVEWNNRIYNDLKGPHWLPEYTPYHLLPQEIQQEVGNLFNKKGQTLEEFEFLERLIKKYKNEFGQELNNNNCQREHLTQLIHIVPYLADHCVVLFDDTFTINDFWVGKCGPCVVYLQCLGFSVKQIFPNGVILTR